VEENVHNALKEFQDLVMENSTSGRVEKNLELEYLMTRDEIMRLYSATGYDHYESFAPFGRQVRNVTSIPETGTIWLHCKNEKYSVQLPCGFHFNF